MQDPDLFLLDEPTAGQDLESMNRIGALISHLHQQNKAVVTITHDMEFVVRNFDRVIVMAHGNIIADGTPREIFWNLEVLKEAALSQPYVSALARRLGVPGDVLTVEEFAAAMPRM